jgi:SPW repeat
MAETDRPITAKWQDVCNLVLGAWLFVSPWILKFTGVGLAPVSAWIFGVIIAVLALLALFAYQQWEEWVNAAIGVWVFVSPWVLGLSHHANILWNSLIVGALLVILALWSVSLKHGSGQVMSRS